MIDHKTIAAHFGRTNEAMRKLKAKGSPLYNVYVKAYKWDTQYGPLADKMGATRFGNIPVTVATNMGKKYVAYNPESYIVKYTDGVNYWAEAFDNINQVIETYKRIINETN